MEGISVIIVNFNTAKLVLDCIASIKENTSGIDYEIIVVDNASEKEDTLILENKLTAKKNIKLIKNTVNYGFARGNNIGIKKAKYQKIMLLNSDTRLKNNVLKILDGYLNEDSKCAIASPLLLNEDGTTQSSAFFLPTLWGAIKKYYFGIDSYGQIKPSTSKKTEVEASVAACWLISPKAIQAVGLLDEKYFMYMEDLDYCRKVRNEGYKVVIFPDAKVLHLHGQSGINIAKKEDQWRRLLPSSKIYHGRVKSFLINFVIWSSTKISRLFSTSSKN